MGMRGGNPKDKPFRSKPGRECVWRARTKTVPDNVAPSWEQELSFSIGTGGDPSLWLQLVLWDSNDTVLDLTDVPIGHAVVSLQDVASGQPGLAVREHCLKL